MRAASERPVQRGGDAALRAWLAVRALALRLNDLPAIWVVAPLVVVQWVVVAAVALRAPHNGWLYYTGGDSISYWTHEWALSHRVMPYTVLGYAVPLAFAWVPFLFGVSMPGGLPAIVLVQVVVLTPVTVACVHAIARRLAGAVFAAFAALVWVVAPLGALPLWRSDYHGRYFDAFMPQLYGLVNMGDFPSLVVLVVAAWLVFRTIDEGRGDDALLAGLTFGLAVGVKPANAVMLPVPFVALLAARRWRGCLLVAVSLVPALVTLALWKQRGLGTMPLFALPAVREAAGAAVPPLANVGHYLDFSTSQLRFNLGQLREFFWSRLLCEFLVVAGSFALLRKSTPKGLYVVLWFAAYYLVKGSAPQADMRGGSYLRLTMPGLPAFLLLAAAVVLLVPGWGRRAAATRRVEAWPRPTPRLLAAVGVLAALPLAVAAGASQASPGTYVRVTGSSIDTPVSPALDLELTRVPDGVRLRWKPPPSRGTRVFYLVFRSRGRADPCSYVGSGDSLCVLQMGYLGRTAITTFVDTPVPGHYQYRVIASASYRAADADFGDVFLTTPPQAFDVRCTTARCRRDVARARAHG